MGWFSSKEDVARASLKSEALAWFTRLESRVRELEVRLEERGPSCEKCQTRREESRSEIRESLPLVDRMQEIALVAMGHADLAQQFGLTTRQKEASTDEPDAQWEEPRDEAEGVTYGG